MVVHRVVFFGSGGGGGGKGGGEFAAHGHVDSTLSAPLGRSSGLHFPPPTRATCRPRIRDPSGGFTLLNTIPLNDLQTKRELGTN